jgi:hypothetical protein
VGTKVSGLTYTSSYIVDIETAYLAFETIVVTYHTIENQNQQDRIQILTFVKKLTGLLCFPIASILPFHPLDFLILKSSCLNTSQTENT